MKITWLNKIFILDINETGAFDLREELKQKGYKLNYSKSLLYFKDKFMMKKNNVREGIENIVKESLEEIDDNLKAIILVFFLKILSFLNLLN